tara:strand:+ start:273 stop:554 length:282 start_codon:yes stop_codon:yes gene_type:complete
MENKKYNGWANYETWRVNLEIFEGVTWDEPVTPTSLKEYVEETVYDLHANDETVVTGWALAFISGVNWWEIAQNINETIENIKKFNEEAYSGD